MVFVVGFFCLICASDRFQLSVVSLTVLQILANHLVPVSLVFFNEISVIIWLIVIIADWICSLNYIPQFFLFLEILHFFYTLPP